MAYTGNIPAEQYISTVKDTFNGNNSTTDFTLSRPSLANNLEVFVENVQQEPTTAYTVSGTTISFTSAPPTGTGNIYVIHRGQAVQTVVPPAGISVNATDLTVTGASALQDGLTVDNDGATVATFDRATSDGDIAVFQKDGSTVGSMGSISTALYVASPSGSDSGLRFDGAAINPCTTAGAYRDNAIDLGSTSAGFKDLYLDGGVYLGGTGAANYFDDYEEGTWTPSVGGTATYQAANYGRYVKIGNVVTLQFRIIINSIGTGSTFRLSALPFTSENIGTVQSGHCSYYSGLAVSTIYLAFYVENNATTCQFVGKSTSGTTVDNGITVFGNGADILGQITYRTT